MACHPWNSTSLLEKRPKMKSKLASWLLVFLLLGGNTVLSAQTAAEKKEESLPLGDAKEGWKVFNEKRCIDCHSIWGEGGKGGPDLGPLPESYLSQSQLAAMMWNHGPEMWGRMIARKIPFLKIREVEMANLFSFLNFIRYMDEPGNPERGKHLMETKGCSKCHTVKEGAKGDLSRWGMYTNPILWAQMMWNHTPQMEQEMEKKGIRRAEFKGNEMVDLIAYIRSVSPKTEKVYLSPGDPQSGTTSFTQKGCVQCHGPNGPLDLSKKRDFPKTVAQLTGALWNHSHEMWKRMEAKSLKQPTLSAQEMANIIAYLYSIRYASEPGDLGRGKTAFVQKHCNSCHGKEQKALDLTPLKGRISAVFMAEAMWNHGPQMLEEMSRAKVPWQKIEGHEMADLMAYLNRGAP